MVVTRIEPEVTQSEGVALVSEFQEQEIDISEESLKSCKFLEKRTQNQYDALLKLYPPNYCLERQLQL